MITFKSDHKYFGDSYLSLNENFLGSHSKYPELSKIAAEYWSTLKLGPIAHTVKTLSVVGQLS